MPLVPRASLSCPPLSASGELWSQLQDLGWHQIRDCKPDLTQLSLGLATSSTSAPSPKLKLTLSPSDFPRVAPTILPGLGGIENDACTWAFQWESETSTLKECFESFQCTLSSLRPLHERLADIDAHCWVLDPQAPNWQDAFRSVALAPGVSLIIELDRKCPEETPKLMFMGPENKVQLLRKNLVERIHLYDPDLPLSRNLEKILLLDFPSAPSDDDASDENFNFDCCICYCRRLGRDGGEGGGNGELPSKCCKDERCARVFHKECLYQYLITCPEKTASKMAVFGKCPYCSTPISCEK